MRAAFATADLAAQLIWRAERFLTALFVRHLMGAMRVAYTRSLVSSGSLRAELGDALILNEIIAFAIFC